MTDYDLASLVLARGGHDSPEKGLCLMEAVAYVRGIPHLEGLPEIVDTATMTGALDALNRARRSGAAAGDAARAALRPTAEELQRSAIDLYRRMAELRP